jgi:hypothetical protein
MSQMNYQTILGMMNSRLQSQNGSNNNCNNNQNNSSTTHNNKMKWGDMGQESLLGMASSLFDHQRSTMPLSIFPSLNTSSQTTSTRPQDITSQVLAELADDLFFDSPTDDIFDDMEPVPINEQHQPQEQRNTRPANDRFALLEETLNQVLRGEGDFDLTLLLEPSSNSMNTTTTTTTTAATAAAAALEAPPMPFVAPSSAMHIQHKRSMEPALQQQQEQEHPNKRQCFSSISTSTDDDDDATGRFRPYQAEQWFEKFEELLAFRKERDHCCVPHTFKENAALARWVKRQRYQYKLKAEDKPSTMTDERIVALENVGFVWDSHGAAWEERWIELREYRQATGHSNVPSNHPSNPQLATWVKCQRRQYKLFWGGKASNMTVERIATLESLGFEWELRGSKIKQQNEWHF